MVSKPSRSEFVRHGRREKLKIHFRTWKTTLLLIISVESFEDFHSKLLDFEKQVNHRIHTTTKKTPSGIV